MDSSHDLVINWIHEKSGQRFAIWELTQVLELSAKTVSRILNILREMKLIGKMPRGYKHKYWETTLKWTNPQDIKSKFEFFCILKQDEMV